VLTAATRMSAQPLSPRPPRPPLLPLTRTHEDDAHADISDTPGPMVGMGVVLTWCDASLYVRVAHHCHGGPEVTCDIVNIRSYTCDLLLFASTVCIILAASAATSLVHCDSAASYLRVIQVLTVNRSWNKLPQG
jgi:hypothetical protein